MKTTRLAVMALLAASLTACAPAPAPAPGPITPRRQAESPTPPPARLDPPPTVAAPPAKKPPQCLLRSKSKDLCLSLIQKKNPRCRSRFCRNVGEYRVVRLDGSLVHKFPRSYAGTPVYLTNKGVVILDPRHAITAPKAMIVEVRAPNKGYVLRASDLLAPSRFITDKVHRKTLTGGAVRIALPGGKTAIFDFETQTVKQPDVHCQAFGKRTVVVSRSVFQKVGTFTVARGTCAKHKALWSMQTLEAPVALTRKGRYVITRNSLLARSGNSHLATVYQRKGRGKVGVVKVRIALRDLTTVKERLAPANCRRAICRASVNYTFLKGGKLQIGYPWGGGKTVDLTRRALLRKKRVPWRYGVDKRTGRAFMGDPRAKVTLLVYGGFQCPYTAAFLRTVKDLLMVQRRGVKVVLADYPIRYHHQGIPAAMAARSVFKHKGARAHWRFADLVFANQRTITTGKLLAWAKEVGADPTKVKADLDARKYEAAVKADMAQGKQRGIRGTPSVFINGKKGNHRSFWRLRAQLKPLLGRLFKPVR
jgi:Thioredoxin